MRCSLAGLLSAGLPGMWLSPDQKAGMQGYEEAGTDLAQFIMKKEKAAKQRGAMSPDIAKALARLSSGLYVVTAANNSAKGAMVASWVAQASFEPLGLSIAVAKDRAIESLMQVSSSLSLPTEALEVWKAPLRPPPNFRRNVSPCSGGCNKTE